MNRHHDDSAGRAVRPPPLAGPRGRRQTPTQPQRKARRGAARNDQGKTVLTLHPPVLRLHVELEEIEPPIWRRFEVPTDITLRRLHDILQLVMGWEDAHLHCFEIRGIRYGFGDNEYDENEREDDRVLLRDVVAHAGDEFRYEYDYGDGWEHRIVVEQIRRDVPPGDVPRLLEGARACPPEDCGGITGYYELLEAIEDPDHEEHDAVLQWVGGHYDPEEYDLAGRDRVLGLVRVRRSIQTPPSRPRRRTTRPRAGASPANERLALLLDALAGVSDSLPEVPLHIFETAGKLLQRHADRAPDAFLAVRKQGIWIAAAIHAAFIIHPMPHLTIEQLAAIFDVSPASVSSRSAELRRD